MPAPKIYPHESLSNIHEYLECAPLVDELALDASNVLSYHWSDHAKQIKKYRNVIGTDSFSGIRLRERIKLMEFQSSKAQEVDVWLANSNGLVKTSLFELYQYYTSDRFKDWLMTKGEVMVSLEKESGPFMPVSSLRWLEREELRPHIFQKLLQGNFPMRGFRLRFNWPVQLVENEDKFSPVVGSIRQLTSRGILIELDGNTIQKLQMTEPDKQLLLEIGLGQLQEVAKLNSEKMMKSLKQLNLDQEWEKCPRLFSVGKIGDELGKMRKSGRQSIHWFLPYSKLPTSMVETFYNLLTGSRDYLESRI